MSLTPFESTTMDPFWNMENMMLGNNMGFPSTVGFPNWTNNLLGFPDVGNRDLGFKNVTSRIGMDLIEEPDKWVVHADLPGYKDEDIELTIENGMLGVRGTREKTTEFDTGISHRVERSFGEVRRAIRLPRGADHDNAHAHLQNGVLTINFPKLAMESTSKKIPLVTAGHSTTKGGKRSAK